MRIKGALRQKGHSYALAAALNKVPDDADVNEPQDAILLYLPPSHAMQVSDLQPHDLCINIRHMPIDDRRQMVLKAQASDFAWSFSSCDSLGRMKFNRTAKTVPMQ